MPDTDRPSGAPLSESEADRLAERFTASWDDPELASPPPAAVPAPALVPAPAPVPVAAPAPIPVPVAAPLPQAPTPTLAKPKHTLLGIAPIVVGPSQPPPAPAGAASSPP